VQSKGPRDNFRAVVRFALPAVPQGCVVESATLRLFSASAKTPRTLQALRLASAWSENLVTWSNQPQTAGAAATAAAGTGYREWPVTAQVQAMYSDANHGFLIRDAVEGQDAEQQFHSRENCPEPAPARDPLRGLRPLTGVQRIERTSPQVRTGFAQPLDARARERASVRRREGCCTTCREAGWGRGGGQTLKLNLNLTLAVLARGSAIRSGVPR
jgi:hypothetical protein